jgi:hypothetical protein
VKDVDVAFFHFVLQRIEHREAYLNAAANAINRTIYRITGLPPNLGEGGWASEVWRATDTKLNRKAAIKILPEALAADRDRMAGLQRETKLVASLNYPNIAAIELLQRKPAPPEWHFAHRRTYLSSP